MMFISLRYLQEIGACQEAREWFAVAYPDGCDVTRQALATVPDDSWVWWLACRLDQSRALGWWAANIAFREAAKACPELSAWIGRVGSDNWRDARAAARAAAYAAADAAAYAAADAAADAAAYAAADAADAAARAADAAADAAACAADAAARAAIWQELKEIAIEIILNLEVEL